MASDAHDFQRVRHARYYEDNVLYHVVFRTTQGFLLLNPDREGHLRRLTAGILARASKTFAGVRNHATSILSNHGHLALSGDHQQLAAYVGFVKRELSRRWGPVIGWRGVFEEGYHATAVITPQAQRRCLKYILAQSVKEGLVAKPDQWPGFHCAAALISGKPIEGEWFNGTTYGTALHRAKRKKNPTAVRREDHTETCFATFDPLPSMAHVSREDYRREMAQLVEEVVTEAQRDRAGRPPLGADAVLATDRMTQKGIPLPPWFEDRRRMVVWDNSRTSEVIAYCQRYWTFQLDFRAVADRWREGELAVEFPPGSFRPGLSRPIPHISSLAA